MIRAANGKIFYLSTDNSSYMISVRDEGYPEHLHYGERLFGDGEISDSDLMNAAAGLAEKQLDPGGNMIQARSGSPLCLERLCLEASSFGKGDISDPLLHVRFDDGSDTCDPVFERYEIIAGKSMPDGLPGAVYEEDDGVEELALILKDRDSGLMITLRYAVFPHSDVIVRSTSVSAPEDMKGGVTIERIMSVQLDLHRTGLVFSSFHGHWADEMHRHDTVVGAGKAVSEGLWAGVSGSRSNPFVMISEQGASEDRGAVIGVNMIYSGDHYEALSADGFDRSRFVAGIQPESFSWRLKPGESFDAPEAVLCYSSAGFGGMSVRMHGFVRRHIVRGYWRDRPRPVLLNSWEANYFKFDAARLVSQARAAAELGIELFVLDDGWFGKRDSDSSSLGDWHADEKKLPGGLGALSAKIHALGISFGLWVEPEMVNERSELYAEHPEWAVRIPGREHAEGRNQMILDLTRTDVQDFMIEEMSRVIREASADYIKWDMNRIMSDRYSGALESGRQGEFGHRYCLGLYRVMRELVTRFPRVLFEGCASGGNRFDLGILSFFPQIWASDDTDAVCRADIQRGYSYGYPMSVLTAHVSASPNHQTLNRTPMETRFDVAVFGCLGYEFDPGDLRPSDRARIKSDTEWYKEWREVFFGGDFYRLEGDSVMAVSADRKKACALMLQRENRPNRPFVQLKVKGLDPDLEYSYESRPVEADIKDFGSLVNTMSPIHIKDGGLIQGIASGLYKLPSAVDKGRMRGSALCACGIRLLPNYSGTGYSDGTRIFRDRDARLILFTAEK